MSQNTIKTEYKARIIADYLQRQVKSLRDRQGAGVEDVGSTGTGGKGRPLMVSMQGPQGAGELLNITLHWLFLYLLRTARKVRMRC